MFSAIIACGQTLLFFTAWLIRMNFIKGATHRFHTLLTLIAILLTIAFFMFIGVIRRAYSKFIWPENNLVSKMPKPQSEYGRIERDNEDEFIIKIGMVKEKDYNTYIEECKNRGFKINDLRGIEYYEAYNEEGDKQKIIYFDHLREMEIRIEGYEELGGYIWSGRGLSSMIPQPKSEYGRIDK